jgi:outer membrane protein
MNRYIYILIILILILIQIPAFGEEKLQMKLMDCIKMAIDTNPIVIKANQNIVIANSQLTQSASLFWPNVKINGQFNVTNATSTTISGGSGSVTTQPSKSSYLGTLAVNQTIFDSFKTWYNYKYALTQLSIAEYNLIQIENELALNVANEYFNTLTSQKMYELNRVLLQQSIKHLEQAQANYEAGITAKADVFSAKVRVTEAKVNLLDAESDLKIKVAQLKSDIGMKRDTNIEIAEEIMETEKKLTLEESITNGIEQRPELKKILAAIEGQEKLLSLAKVNSAVQFNIGVGLNFDFARDPGTSQKSYTASAVLSVPLFDGFSSEAKVDETEARLVSYEADRTDIEKQISLDVETAYYTLETAIAKIELTTEQAEEARKNLDVSEGRYAAGVSSFQELLDAQIAYKQSMTNLITSRYNYQISLYTFKKALGEELYKLSVNEEVN